MDKRTLSLSAPRLRHRNWRDRFTRALRLSRYCVPTKWAAFLVCLFGSTNAFSQSTWDHDPIFGTKTNAETLVKNHSKHSLLRAAASDPRFENIRPYIATLPDTTAQELPHFISEPNEKKARLLLLEDTLETQRVSAALSPETEELICPWFDQKLRALDKVSDELYRLHFAHCASDDYPLLENKTAKPTESERLRRATRMYRDVRFKNAATELDIVTKKVSDAAFCDAWFLRGRTMYRIKKRRKESEIAYKKVAEKCTDRENSAHWTLRKKALYGWGKRRFDLKDYRNAKKPFEQLIKDYPDTSHVDDALLYLARIARRLGDKKEEKKIVERAMEKDAHGDMTFEIAWEHLEPSLKAGKHKTFLKRLGELKLPEHDTMYFSQGRLEYFTAFAHQKLKAKQAANNAWKNAWNKYPFSFYGYLSALRLDARKVDREALQKDEQLPAWAESKHANRDDLAVALRHAPELAEWIARNTTVKDESKNWRIAQALDAVGQYPSSHNIVRRRIKNRPWISPEKGRMTRLRIAWPMPHEELVKKAVEAEQKQHPKAYLHPAFPTAIMREESSFVEDIESWAGALGLMQLMPRTALGHDDDIDGDATPDRLRTAEVNVRVAADHLFWLSRRVDAHPALMAASYNAGLGAVNRWLKSQPNDEIALFVEDIPYLQARDYTKRVVGSYAAYQFLMGEEKLDNRLANPAKK